MAAPGHKKEEITKEAFMKMSDEGKWEMFQVRGAIIDMLTGKCQQMENAFFKMGKGGKKQ